MTKREGVRIQIYPLQRSAVEHQQSPGHPMAFTGENIILKKEEPQGSQSPGQKK
jgi:hypothetical protein